MFLYDLIQFLEPQAAALVGVIYTANLNIDIINLFLAQLV
jgi:hypothetical protein